MSKTSRRPYGLHYRNEELAGRGLWSAAAPGRRPSVATRGTRLVPRAVLVALLMVALLLPMGNVIGSNRPVLAETGGVSGQTGTASTAQGAVESPTKDEVVYGMLESDGTPKQSYVINHFEVEKAGTLTDFGSYDSLSNLSTTERITTDADKVSVPVQEGNFYYQGTLNKTELPWKIAIEYTLNGTKVTSAQLAGASGDLVIHITTARNTAVDPVFFDNYLLQIQLTLSSERAKRIAAEGATIADAGKDRQVAFMVMPGKDGDLKLSAEVNAFEMPSIQISGIPFSMAFDMPDTQGMVDDMAELTDAIRVLNDGVAELKNGVAQLQDGGSALASGSGDIGSALQQFNESGGQLKTAAVQIDAALAAMAGQLNGSPVDTSQLGQLVGGLRRLSTALSNPPDPSHPEAPWTPGMAEGLTQIQRGIDDAVSALDGRIAALNPVGAEKIGALGADPGFAGLSFDSQATLQNLIGVNTGAAYVVGTWYGPNGNDGVKAGLTAASAGLTESIEGAKLMAAQLATTASGLESSLSSLSDLTLLASYIQQLSTRFTGFKDGLSTYTAGLGTLAGNYGSFDNGLKQYIGGTDSLYSGISALYNGTNELYIHVEDLPQTMRDEIDSFMKDYQTSDFELKSFVSDKNTNIERVQFVLVSDPVEIPEPPAVPVAEDVTEKTAWDRLLDLFR